jgi:hypothetical protein
MSLPAHARDYPIADVPYAAALLRPGLPVQPEAIQTDFTGTYPDKPAIPTWPILSSPSVNKD